MAHKAQPLPWTAQAQLEHHASAGYWEDALRTVEAAVASRQIDGEAGDRQRAVLETAIGYDKEMTEPDAALALARAAMKRAPDLAPPVVLAVRLLSRRGDIRKAAKLVEKAWPRCPHPDIAEAYMNVRPGDSTTDRLARARMLMGLSAYDPVSRLTVARAALSNIDFASARAAMEPLVSEGRRPTVKMCLLMAELEESEHGDDGLWREWLARASRAALDPAWMADGIVHDEWAPASPSTGRLDAFRWQVPAERPGLVMDALPPRRTPSAALAPQASLLPVNESSSAAPDAEAVPDAVVPSGPEPIVEHPTHSAEAVPGLKPLPQVAPPEPSLYDSHDKAAAIMALPSVPVGNELAPPAPPQLELATTPAFKPATASKPEPIRPPSTDRPGGRSSSIYHSG